MAGPQSLGGPDTAGPVRVSNDDTGDRGGKGDRYQREVHAPPRKRWIPGVVLLVLMVGGFIGGWLWFKSLKLDEKPGVATTAPPLATSTAFDPDVPKHYPPPVPPATHDGQAEAKPLPPLDQSDAIAREALAELVGSETVARLLSTQDLIRHIVVTVDNLPRKSVATRLNPLKPAGGEFKVSGDAQQPTIAVENAIRYAAYVKLAEQIDAKKAVNAYGRLYPLFQKAYEDLGYPKSFFNDRLIAVIDHLLAAPDVQGPVPVVAPHVQYQFADPDLEAQSAGRKFLMRAGPGNSAAIKSKLREIRRELTKTGTGK